MVQLHIMKVNLVRNHAYFSKYERYLMDMPLVTKGEVKFNSSKLDWPAWHVIIISWPRM